MYGIDQSRNRSQPLLVSETGHHCLLQPAALRVFGERLAPLELRICIYNENSRPTAHILDVLGLSR